MKQTDILRGFMNEDSSATTNVMNLLIILLSKLWDEYDRDTGELHPRGVDYLETAAAVSIFYYGKLTGGNPKPITGAPAEILSEIESMGAQLQ
jgi:hypothetical protein